MKKFKNDLFRVLIIQFLKSFLIMFVVLIFLNWITTNAINIIDSALFAAYITGGILIPCIAILKIIPPEINNKTSQQRVKIYKKNYTAIKLISMLTIFVTVFFMLLWVMIPVFELSFWEALVCSFIIGLVFSIFCNLIVRYIIKMENPPFQV